MTASFQLTSDAATAAAKVTSHLLDLLPSVGEHLIEEANRVVPMDEGTLADSGHHVTTLDDAGHPLLVVAYEERYAAAQEVREDYSHAPGRQAHYLRDTVQQNIQHVEGFLVDGLRSRGI